MLVDVLNVKSKFALRQRSPATGSGIFSRTEAELGGIEAITEVMSWLLGPTSRICLGRMRQSRVLCLYAVFCLSLLNGCSTLRPKPQVEYVYVTAKQTFLRDRVAQVAERTGTVANGDRLQVLEHAKHYFKVKTEKDEQGWIEEKAVATQAVFDGFQTLRQTHQNDPPVASAVVRADEANLHLKPGRDTDRFYRLVEGDKLQMLQRATLPKPQPAGAVAARSARPAGNASKPAAKPAAKPGTGPIPQAAPDATPDAPPPVPMEDWWLVHDAQGRTGWILSRYIEVDAPETLTRYAEGQRFVGAYVLTKVHDDGAPQEDKDIPIYLALMGPYTAGLPYDFDQVRVFTWSVKMHRYETAFREKNIEGYLPVTIKDEKDPYGKSVSAQEPLPTFTYKVLAEDAGPVAPDPATGTVTPGRTISRTYRLEGNVVRRITPPGTHDEPAAHPVAEEKKPKGKKK
jgi:uncharacterized protein YgiM (DUF1202 family)